MTKAQYWTLRVIGWGGFAAATYLWGVAGFFLVFGLSAIMLGHVQRGKVNA